MARAVGSRVGSSGNLGPGSFLFAAPLFEMHAQPGREEGDKPAQADCQPLELDQKRGGEGEYKKERAKEEKASVEHDAHQRKSDAAGESHDGAKKGGRSFREMKKSDASDREEDEGHPDSMELPFDEATDSLVAFEEDQDDSQVERCSDRQGDEIPGYRVVTVLDKVSHGPESAQIEKGVHHPDQAPVVGDEILVGVADYLPNDAQRFFGFLSIHSEGSKSGDKGFQGQAACGPPNDA